MVVYDTVAPVVVLQMDFGNVVGSPTGGYTEVEVTIVGRVLRFYAPTSGGGGTTVHNDLSGLNAGDYQHLTVAEKANIALKDAGAFTTVAPTSAVAASGSTDLMRKGETDTGLAGKQALDATLTALAGLATGADKLAYSTGTDTFAQADLTSFGRSLIGVVDAATARTALDVRSPHVYTIWTGPTVGYIVPSAEGLFLGSAPWSCQPYDGTRATQARITGCHIGAASSGTVYLRAKYTTNGQAAGTYNTVGTWTQLGASAQVVATMGTGAGANYFDSGWIDIASGAKIDGMIAVTGLGGNGSTSITFYKLNIEFR